MPELSMYRSALANAALFERMGAVQRVQGLAIESDGPDVALGEMCRVHAVPEAQEEGVLAEVVALQPGRVTLLPYGELRGVRRGDRVVALGRAAEIGVGPALLGRVIDGFGTPLDGGPALGDLQPVRVVPFPSDAMARPRIQRVLETGVRCIDALLTIGEGQRLGVFAGSGVGKSSLLGMITRHAKVDVNVVALIGERSREVREFVEEQLGPAGLSRSVVVVATSDKPPLARIRAAHAAVAIAGHFRDRGQSVLLTMDSITRLAMARREVGLASGEPATARGYTPSVFAELPVICEGCGTSPGGGSVTALFSVLVEGDDLQDPVADSMRSLLDGHIVLSRGLAQEGHFPAIDVLQSVSRLMTALAGEGEKSLAATVVRHLATLEKNRQLVELGAYVAGANPVLDEALRIEARLFAWLRQDRGGVARAEALRELAQVLTTKEAR